MRGFIPSVLIFPLIGAVVALSVALAVPMSAFAGKGGLQVRAAAAPPDLSVTAAFSEPSGNGILNAEEAGTLTVTVTNAGAGDGFDVKAMVSIEKKVAGFTFDREVSFGTIPSKGKAERTIRLTGGENLATGDVRLTATFDEGNGFPPEPVVVSFRTAEFVPPKLVVADMGVVSADGSSKVSPGTVVEVTARVQNTGAGDARNVVAEVEYGANVFSSGDGSSRFDLGSLPSGQFKDIHFAFYTNKKIQNGAAVPVTIRLSEARPRFAATHPLGLAMNSVAKGASELVVKGSDAPKVEGKVELAGGLSVDVDMKIPQGRWAEKYDVAVVIGNRNYSAPGVAEVAYADRDAAVVREYLVSTFGFDPKNIIYEKDAGVAKFQEIFGTANDPKGKLSRFVKEGVSRVFVYYSGHGAPDLETQEAFLLPSDANPNYLGSTGYRLKTFYENLSKIPAKGMTIVLDACFSGSSEKGLLFQGVSPAMVKVKKEFDAPRNALLLTGGAVDQVAVWYPEKKHSLFTYYFLKGIGGAADTDGKGAITVGGLKAYLAENVPYMANRLKGFQQTPVVTGNDADVMVRLTK